MPNHFSPAFTKSVLGKPIRSLLKINLPFFYILQVRIRNDEVSNEILSCLRRLGALCHADSSPIGRSSGSVPKESHLQGPRDGG